MRMYASDVRACGLCLVPGAKNLCEAHGIDWREFIQDGIELSRIEHIDDGFIQQVIAHIKKERT